MSVGRLCLRDVHLADPDERIDVAARRMGERGVGTLVILDADRRPIGLVTDRDLVLRVLAPGRDPARTTVGEVMTRAPHCVSENTSLEEGLSLMRSGGFRRLPVVGTDGRLVGIICLDDVLGLLAEEAALIGGLLERSSPRPMP